MTDLEKLKNYLKDKDSSIFELHSADFENADLRGITLKGVVSLNNSNFINANFEGANLAGAFFAFSDFTNANLSNTNLSGAFFNKSNLTHANLQGANLSKATLPFTTLKNANLSKANLVAANLFGSDLTNAILKDSVLIGADFSEADLTGVETSLLNLNYCTLNDTIGLDNTKEIGGINDIKDASSFIEEDVISGRYNNKILTVKGRISVPKYFLEDGFIGLDLLDCKINISVCDVSGAFSSFANQLKTEIFEGYIIAKGKMEILKPPSRPCYTLLVENKDDIKFIYK